MASRSDWDAKYRLAQGLIPEPDPFLAEALAYVRQFAPNAAKAVDIAAGSGRHACAMAAWGLRTLAIDFSAEGLRTCAERALAANLAVETACLDLEDSGVDLGEERFDVVAVFHFLHRPLVPTLRRITRPGGVVIYKTYTQRQVLFGTGPKNPDYLLAENELVELFKGFRPLLYRETCESEATAALIAQRS